MVKITNTEAAVSAAQSYAERTGTCVQEALWLAGSFAYCHCTDCEAAAAAEAASETYAEGAWLRAAENDGHGYVAGCPCC